MSQNLHEIAPMEFISVDAVMKEEPLDYDSNQFFTQSREEVLCPHTNVSVPAFGGTQSVRTRPIDMDMLMAVVEKLEVVTEKLSSVDDYDHFGKCLASLLRKVPEGKLNWIKMKLIGEVNLALDFEEQTTNEQCSLLLRSPNANKIRFNKSPTMQAPSVLVPASHGIINSPNTNCQVRSKNPKTVVNQAGKPVKNPVAQPVVNQVCTPLYTVTKLFNPTANSAMHSVPNPFKNHVISDHQTINENAIASDDDESRTLSSAEFVRELPSLSSAGDEDLTRPAPSGLNPASARTTVDSSLGMLKVPFVRSKKIRHPQERLIQAVKAVEKGTSITCAAKQYGVSEVSIYIKLKGMNFKKEKNFHLWQSKKKYSQEELAMAIEAVKGGMKRSVAVRLYGIPWSTLNDRTAFLSKSYSQETNSKAVKAIKKGGTRAAKQDPRRTVRRYPNGVSLESRKGRSAILSATEEKQLVEWLDVMIKAGLPVTRKQMMSSARAFLKNLGKPKVDLGKWVGRFVQRNRQHFSVEDGPPMAMPDTILGKGTS